MIIAGLGGTFDHLHVGHQHFLQFAAQQADELWVGLTVQKINDKKRWAKALQSFEVRANFLEKELQKLERPFRIFPLTDSFGPTLQNSPVQKLVVTNHSVEGGELINSRRQELGLDRLPISVSNLLTDSSGKIISSTRIRSGELQRSGRSWLNEIIFTPLAEGARQALAAPLGEIVHKPFLSTALTIVVGDVCYQHFTENHWHFDLAVVDGKTQQQPVSLEYPNLVGTIVHPAGSLLAETSHWLRHFFDTFSELHSSSLLFIQGEEDLVAAEALLTAPLGSHIYYGQPNKGMVKIEVSESKKAELVHILST